MLLIGFLYKYKFNWHTVEIASMSFIFACPEVSPTHDVPKSIKNGFFIRFGLLLDSPSKY